MHKPPALTTCISLSIGQCADRSEIPETVTRRLETKNPKGIEIVKKKMSDGSAAVVLFNRGEVPQAKWRCAWSAC